MNATWYQLSLQQLIELVAKLCILRSQINNQLTQNDSADTVALKRSCSSSKVRGDRSGAGVAAQVGATLIAL